jgi:hypothetical protein
VALSPSLRVPAGSGSGWAIASGGTLILALDRSTSTFSPDGPGVFGRSVRTALVSEDFGTVPDSVGVDAVSLVSLFLSDMVLSPFRTGETGPRTPIKLT